METNLTQVQLGNNKLPQWAVFLPATSSFYSSFISKQRYRDYVEPSRIPAHLTNSVESLNYLDPAAIFYYRWNLYSAGHADLVEHSTCNRDDMFRNRNRNTSFTLADSGGFQIAKTRWPANWKDPTCPLAQKKRSQVLFWMDKYMDSGMVLDIPVWVVESPEGREATNIHTFADAVAGTKINNDYFIRNRNGNCKFLNVLQGETHTQADAWYNHMKSYCDPKVYPDAHFNGWAMGGQNKCDLHLLLKRLVTLRFDGLLEQNVHDHLHILGTSKLEWAVMLTDIQNAVRKYHNPNFMITFDCASPFLATANAHIYHDIKLEDRGKWSYKMGTAIDDKNLYQDTRLYRDAILQDTNIGTFEDSPITKPLKISDICVYGPKDKNKLGLIGKTSWDSFAYLIQMGHNVWAHITAVQRANQAYEKGIVPNLLVRERFDVVFVRDLVNEVLSLDDLDRALKLIDDNSRLWMEVPGNTGLVGKKTLNSKTMFAQFFESVDHNEEFTQDEEHALEELESEEENS